MGVGGDEDNPSVGNALPGTYSKQCMYEHDGLSVCAGVKMKTLSTCRTWATWARWAAKDERKRAAEPDALPASLSFSPIAVGRGDLCGEHCTIPCPIYIFQGCLLFLCASKYRYQSSWGGWIMGCVALLVSDQEVKHIERPHKQAPSTLKPATFCSRHASHVTDLYPQRGNPGWQFSISVGAYQNVSGFEEMNCGPL